MRLSQNLQQFFKFNRLLLGFNDEALESSFNVSKHSFRTLIYRYFGVSLSFLFLAHFFSNSISINFNEPVALVSIISGFGLLLGSYSLIARMKIVWTEYANIVLLIALALVSGELALAFPSKGIINSSLFVTLGIQFQTASMLLIISCPGWGKAALAVFFLQSYLLSFLYRGLGENIALAPLLIFYLTNILFLPALAFCNELKARELFLQLKQTEKNLQALQFLFKTEFPVGVILLCKEKISFINDKIRDLFGISSAEELSRLLSEIEVTSQSTIEFRSPHVEGTLTEKRNLAEIIAEVNRTLKKQASPKKISRYEAAYHLVSKGETLFFDVQIGMTFWEGEHSIFLFFSEHRGKPHSKNEAENNVGMILATISHELRTPLNGILGSIEFALEKAGSNFYLKPVLDVMQVSAKQLLSSINNILDLCLFRRGKLTLNVEIANLLLIIADTIGILETRAKLKNLVFKFEHNIQNPFVKIDPNRLQQILLNLIGNAIKDTCSGEILLRVVEKESPTNAASHDDPLQSSYSLYAIEEDTLRMFAFECVATGREASDEDQGEIFELLGKIKNASNRPEDNQISVSLEIDKILIKELNKINGQAGDLEVNNFRTDGPNFLFNLHLFSRQFFKSAEKLPFKEPVVSGPVILRSPLIRPKFTGTADPIKSKLKTTKVLAVDDDQINLLVLRNYLEKTDDPENNYELTTASNGFEALNVIKEKAKQQVYFDVILMDCNMPLMDGFEATRIIKSMILKKELQNICVVAITANLESVDKKRCSESGMEYFLTKPLKKKDLLSTIKKALKHEL